MSIHEAEGAGIGRYRLIRRLGRGGMGAVWLAEHTQLHTKFAMKMASGDRDGVLRSCLRTEAERMKALHDRRIPYLVDFFEDDECSVLVMEYVEGITLEEYIGKNAPMDEEEALVLMKELCDIVAFLHNSRPQILYRDIKPSNFMISAGGELRLLDFGTALSQTGDTQGVEICGTRGYAAPEQLKNSGARADADVYSLAAVYSYMLSAVDPASPPFHPLSGEELGRMVSRSSKKLIDLCLSPDPDKRPANGMALKERLDKIRPGREKLLNSLEEHLYQLFMWIQVSAACILLWSRYRGHPVPGAEFICYSISLLSLLWSVIRDELFDDPGFVLQRSWNIVLSAKEGPGLHF